MDKFVNKEFYTIVAGACLLAVNAGFINVVTLAGIFSVTVSHLTGNVSRIAIALYNLDLTTMALVISIIVSFMFGSFVAGFMIGDTKFRLGRSYGYALLIECLMLFLSFLFLGQELILGEWCAAFACGLQNAVGTSYSGAVIRTTHMTGIITDIGNILGQACRMDTNAEVWRLKVHIPLLFSYLVGGIFGQLAYSALKEHSLLIPCIFTGLIGSTYLCLPWVNEAAKILKEATIHTQGQMPAVEVRVIGDPRGGDKFAKVSGRNVDIEIREFLHDIDSDDEHDEADSVSLKSPRNPQMNQIQDEEKTHSIKINSNPGSGKNSAKSSRRTSVTRASGGGNVEILYSPKQ
ncbi:hypothetical protein SmJEL517_g06036 [Synchytrium microbalum]|uniref:DUF1275 domain-containing protein n=1 Tax=Synchytrium microbalum TaxID=1806994 RepID=A0A507BX70_9FUNG|nr:uncharacterized protein SmJEL517_g06036 [Synchytrium microbalum]TPX30384.1 hypothetical protein SmJEL517_g06036 [Synchytrium microbalum]